MAEHRGGRIRRGVSLLSSGFRIRREVSLLSSGFRIRRRFVYYDLKEIWLLF
jgi:hypothetical protein